MSPHYIWKVYSQKLNVFQKKIKKIFENKKTPHTIYGKSQLKSLTFLSNCRTKFGIFLYLGKTIVAHLKKGVNKKLTPLTIFIIGQEAKSGYPSCRNSRKCNLFHFPYPAYKISKFATLFNLVDDYNKFVCSGLILY